MALNLEELRFVVDTTELDAAAKKISALGDALNKVNKPVKESAINAEKLAQAQANTAEATAKAELAATKAALAAEKLGKAQDTATDSSKKGMTILERQVTILENMAKGYSRGDASILATAKAMGVANEELAKIGETRQAQRALTGADPFDKSQGAIEAWTNKLKIAAEMDSLYAQGLGLTKTQLKELAIEKQRLITLADMEGKTLKDAETEYRKLIGIAANLAQQENALTTSLRQKDKALTDSAKAAAYVADADARLAAALDVSNAKLDKAGSDALVKYEKNLRLMGLSSDEAAAKLAHAKTQFDAIADKKQADKLQYLARAISVQMGDVGISLASGMNPLLVMIQQGDQIRGAIQQAGASGKELEKAMSGAATQIATSFMQTAQAMGGFFVSAIKSAGSAVIDGLVAPFKRLGESREALKQLDEGIISTLRYSRLMEVSGGRMLQSFIALGTVIAVVAVAGLVAYGMALKEVIKQEADLSKAANLSGGSLGLTTNKAQELANAFAGVKGNVGDYMGAITEAAKAGNITSDNLQTVTSAAINLNKAAGVSIESTVKEFSKLADKPTTALIDLAKTTGLIDPEILKVVDSLERQGKKAEAAAIATRAYADALNKASGTIQNDMGYLEGFFKGIAEAATSMWNAILNVGRKGTLTSQLETAKKELEGLKSGAWFEGGIAGTGIMTEQYRKNSIQVQEAVIAGIEKEIAAQKKLADEKEANNKAAKKIEEDIAKRQAMGGFTAPKDLKLEELKTNYSNTLKEIDADTNKLLTESKNRYALGLTDTGDFLSEELTLIRDQNNKKLSENDKYIAALEKARSDQEAKIKAEGARAIFVGGVAKSDAETKKMKDALDQLNAIYKNLIETVKTSNSVIADKSVEQQTKALDNLGQYTKKVIEGSKEFARTLEDTATKRKLQIDLENQLAGLSGGELARVKAQIEAEQSHVAKLSELQDAALKAGVAMSKLTLSGLDPSSSRYKDAEQAVKNANTALEEAKGKSRQEIVQAGIDAEMLYYAQEYNKLKANISDALVTALIDGGEAGGKKLRDIIIAELKKPITIVVNAVVNSLSGMVSSGLNSMLGGTAGSSLGSTIGNLSIGGTTLAAIGAQAQAFGAGIVSGFGPLAGMQSGGLATSGAYNMGAAAAPAAGAVGGVMLNKGISSGYEINKTLTDLQNVATVAAAFIPGLGPLVSLGIGAVSGLANRAFGMKAKEITGEGIVGTLKTQGADVQAFEDWFQKGGWFRSNKSGRNLSKISDSLQEYLDTSLLGLNVTTKKYADALGIDASGLGDVTKAIELNLKGLSADERKKKVDEALGGFGDELAKKLGLESYDALQKLGEQVLQQRYDLETQLLTLQGDTVALRERERAKIYETNQALYDQIKALEDKKAADEEAAKALEKLTSITTTIVTEINRLRGVNTSQTGLESQFAIITAQARSGDLEALAKLPSITQGLEQIAGATAVNATDIVMARARLAQSLQDTLGYVGASGFTASPSATSAVSLASVSAMGTGATATVSATSSNQELLSALVTEVQGLRAEVRADVSHNAKTAKILERANQDGETLSVSATIDGGVV